MGNVLVFGRGAESVAVQSDAVVAIDSAAGGGSNIHTAGGSVLHVDADVESLTRSVFGAGPAPAGKAVKPGKSSKS